MFKMEKNYLHDPWSIADVACKLSLLATFWPMTESEKFKKKIF